MAALSAGSSANRGSSPAPTPTRWRTPPMSACPPAWRRARPTSSAASPSLPRPFSASRPRDVSTRIILRARRIDLVASFKLDPLTLDLHYANYAAQRAIGFDLRRQGLSASARYDVTENYFLNGAVTFDMSRHLYNSLTSQPRPEHGAHRRQPRRHGALVLDRGARRRRRLSRRMHDAVDQLFVALSAAIDIRDCRRAIRP